MSGRSRNYEIIPEVRCQSVFQIFIPVRGQNFEFIFGGGRKSDFMFFMSEVKISKFSVVNWKSDFQIFFSFKKSKFRNFLGVNRKTEVCDCYTCECWLNCDLWSWLLFWLWDCDCYCHTWLLLWPPFGTMTYFWSRHPKNVHWEVFLTVALEIVAVATWRLWKPSRRSSNLLFGKSDPISVIDPWGGFRSFHV